VTTVVHSQLLLSGADCRSCQHRTLCSSVCKASALTAKATQECAVQGRTSLVSPQPFEMK